MTPAAPASSQPERPDAFISYSRQDGEFVRGLVRALEARGKDVWVDLDDIPKSADWLARVEQGIESAKAVVVVLSPALAASQICGQEIRHAIEHHKRLIPILLSDVEPEQLFPELNAPNWILAREQDDGQAAFQELVGALETDLAWLEVHARLVSRSVEWDRQNRDGSLLLRGDDLGTARRWLAAQGEHREQPTELQVEYIGASRRSALIRRAVVGVAALGVFALTGFLLVQRDRTADEQQRAKRQEQRADLQERLAESRRLSADAIAQLDTDSRRGLATALKAHAAAPTPEATQALRQALMRPRPERTLRASDSFVLSAEFIDADTVRGQTVDGEIMRWPLGAGRPVVIRRGVPLPPFRSRFPISREANLIARPAAESVRVATAANGTVLVLEELRRLSPGNGRTAALSPDGRRIVTAGYDRDADVWRVPARVIQPPLGTLVICAAATRAYIVTCSDDRSVVIWPSDPSRPPQTVFDRGPGRYGSVWDDVDVAASASGSQVFVTSRYRGDITVIDADSGKIVDTHKGRRFSPPVLSADGKRLLFLGTRRFRVEGTNGREIAAVPYSSNDLFGPPALDAAGERVAVYLGDGVRVWNVASGNETAHLPRPKDEPGAFAISSSGEFVGMVDDGLASIFHSDDNSRVTSFRVPGNPRDMEFSRDEAFVVSAGNDVARVWELETGRPVASFGGHRHPVNRASFDTRANRVVTVGLDGLAISHDCPACAPPATLVKRARAALRVRLVGP